MTGHINAIHIAPVANAPMEAVERIACEAGVGIAGDRYFGEKAMDNVTLVGLEAQRAVAAELGIPYTPGSTRRNLTVEGLDPLDLVGKRFRIGEVLLEGIEPAEPCNNMETWVGTGAKALLAGRAGIRATILESGAIRVGDSIVEE